MKILISLFVLFISVQLYAEELRIPDTGVCIVKYYTDNCWACVRLSTELQQIDNAVKLSWKNPPGVKEYPVLVFYVNGKAREACTGFMAANEIRDKIKELTK